MDEHKITDTTDWAGLIELEHRLAEIEAKSGFSLRVLDSLTVLQASASQ